MTCNTYQLEARARCPVDRRVRDVYEVTVVSSRPIKVEKILAFFSARSRKAIFQEALTKAAAKALGAQVTTVGFHSGVKTTAVAP